jgi:circadian clock protein KaiC
MAAGEQAEGGTAPRISSGTSPLDQVLQGGWLRGGVYIVAGPPGTGKTTLGNQFAFAAAERGESAVYITLMAETHARMMLHLRTLAFFQPGQVGERVYYVSGTTVLKEEGLQGLLELMRRTVRERGARVLVIDGFTLVRERAESVLAQREFLHALGVLCGLTDCTALLLSTEVNKAADVEYAMVDGILALSAELHGLKATRGLEVIKFRGSGHLAGKHTFLIDEGGVRVYPRWEALHRQNPKAAPDPDTRLTFGIPRLDAMCLGGLVRRSSTLLFGSPGCGKTLLGLHFLAEGARRGEPALYFGFSENAPQLVRKGQSVGLLLAPLVEGGLLRIETRAPVETLPDAIAQEVMGMVRAHGSRRLFIDGLEPLVREALDPERATRFISAFLNALRDSDVTVVVTQQGNVLFGPELRPSIPGSEAVCDNILFLRYIERNGRLHRLLSILKMRDSDNDPSLREMVISSQGVEIREGFGALEATMSGQPHQGKKPRKRPSPPARKRGGRRPGGRR